MKRIVLVEDDFIIALLLEKQIQRMGYHVSAKVDNAEAAIDSIKNEGPDLVLMDIKLVGDMDGIDAMKQVRQFSNIPVIYLTGNADDNTKERARTTNPKGFLIKPVDMEVLKRTITGIMEKNSIN